MDESSGLFLWVKEAGEPLSDELQCKAAEILWISLSGPPFNFEWKQCAEGEEKDFPDANAPTALSLVLKYQYADWVFLCKGDCQKKLIPENIVGVAAGAVITNDILKEVFLEERGAKCGDYYAAAVSILSNYRGRFVDKCVKNGEIKRDCSGRAYQQMCHERLAIAKENGCKTMWVRTLDGHPQVIRAYLSMGFAVCGTPLHVDQGGCSTSRVYLSKVV